MVIGVGQIGSYSYINPVWTGYQCGQVAASFNTSIFNRLVIGFVLDSSLNTSIFNRLVIR